MRSHRGEAQNASTVALTTPSKPFDEHGRSLWWNAVHVWGHRANELQEAWSASPLILFSKSQMAGIKPHRSLFHLADTLRAYGILMNVSAQTWEASIKVLRRFIRGGGNGISESGIQYGVGGSLLLGTHTQKGVVDPSSAGVAPSHMANIRSASRSTLGALLLDQTSRDRLVPENLAIFVGISIEELLVRAADALVDISLAAYLSAGNFVGASTYFSAKARQLKKAKRGWRMTTRTPK